MRVQMGPILNPEDLSEVSTRGLQETDADVPNRGFSCAHQGTTLT